MSNLEPEQIKQAESAPSSPENAPESAEKKEESALYYTKWQQRMMKKGYVVTPKVKKPAKQNAIEWIATLVGALLLVLLLKAFVGSPVVVDGNSMYPTLHNGEIMMMSKLHYGTSYFFNQPIVLGGEPERFDVVVCRYPDRGSTNFVKRVVGLPGETIEIADGVVLIDGNPLSEPYLDPAHCRFRRSMPPRVLGADEYFVMGDNRDNSNDSRSVGALKRSAIRARVVRVLFRLPSLKRKKRR